MGTDRNRPEAAKPPSIRSRLDDVERELEQSLIATRSLCEALLASDEPMKRAKLLALQAAMSDSGRGARHGNDGE